MSGVIVIGAYDIDPAALHDVDLMRFLAGVGVPLAGVIFRSTIGKAYLAFDGWHNVADNRRVAQVASFDAPATIQLVREAGAELLVYAGGRDLLRAPLLVSAPLGCIGGHYGRLPRIRGMSTVEWSVLAGVPPAVAIQRIHTGIDTGAIVMQADVPLLPGDTFLRIRERSYFMTKTMLALSAQALLAGRTRGERQDIAGGRQYYRLHPALLALAERKLPAWLERTNPQASR